MFQDFLLISLAPTNSLNLTFTYIVEVIIYKLYVIEFMNKLGWNLEIIAKYSCKMKY